MTSELKANEYISEFVSGGPKNYGYKLCNSVTVCEVLGITLNYKTWQLVNLETFKDLALKGDPTAPSRFTLIKISTERESTVLCINSDRTRG